MNVRFLCVIIRMDEQAMKDFIVSNPFGKGSARVDRAGLLLYPAKSAPTWISRTVCGYSDKIRRLREVRQNRHRAVNRSILEHSQAVRQAALTRCIGGSSPPAPVVKCTSKCCNICVVMVLLIFGFSFIL